MSAPNSLFVRAAKAQPTERTPVWFMRQAGRYMAEYRAIRKQYSLIEICKKPEVAAQVTIEAAEILKVDAAIIFADLLLPLEVMGLPFHFSAGEGPKIEKPVRTAEDIAAPAHRPRRRSRLCFRGRETRVQALRRQAPRHRLLRRALHASQLHDRRWRLAQLPFHQEDDVLRARRVE
jgi:uroporphyrinogen-III decarboxylase